MIGNLLQPELVELIRKRDFTQLREILRGFAAPDLAEIFVDLKPDDEAVLLRLLPHDLAAEVFEYLPVEDQECLQCFSHFFKAAACCDLSTAFFTLLSVPASPSCSAATASALDWQLGGREKGATERKRVHCIAVSVSQ